MTRYHLLFGSVVSLMMTSAGAAQDTKPITVTRWVLSHGCFDGVRTKGIRTPENAGGIYIHHLTPTGAPLPMPPETTPLDPKYTIFDWIAAQPDPMHITLDADNDGKADKPEDNALVLAGANIPSCFTLVVDESNRTPGGRSFWRIPHPRFGGGNMYATVNISDAEGNVVIARGKELVTPEQYDLYTPNSVLYMAPDVGLSPQVQDAQLDGGTENIGFRTGGQPNGSPVNQLIGFADPLEVTIVERGQYKYENGRVRVHVEAVLDRLFEDPSDCIFRWAVEANSGTLIEDVAADPNFIFALPIDPPPNEEFPIEGPPDRLVKVTVVVTPYNYGASGSPFIHPPPAKPQSVGLETFVSRSCTISDTEAISVDTDSPDAPAHSICILLDASGSMKDNNKMDKAKASATRVLKRIGSGTEIALIVFYSCSSIVVEHEFTTEADKVAAILPRIQPSGGTPLAKGIAFAKDYMRKHASGKNLDLIVLSDGKESCQGDPVAAARP